MGRYRKPTLKEQIVMNADVARDREQDRALLWTALKALLANEIKPEEAKRALSATARCACGSRTYFDLDKPQPYGLTCERCLST